MKRLVRVWMRAVLLSAAVALSVGCAKPCEKLADQACAKAGEQSEHCTKLRAQAERARPADDRQCRRALDMVRTLDRRN